MKANLDIIIASADDTLMAALSKTMDETVYSFQQVSSLNAAMNIAQFDAIIIDDDLEELSIHCQRIRQANQQATLLLLTSKTAVPYIDQMIAQGVDDIVMKPICPALLNKKLVALVARYYLNHTVDADNEMMQYTIKNTCQEMSLSLAAIRELNRLLLNAGLSKAQQVYLRSYARYTDNLMFNLQNLQGFDEIINGLIDLNIRHFSMNDLIRRVVEQFADKAEEKNLELILTMTDDIPELKGDAEKIYQVLLNLMNNAIQYTATGEIELGIEVVSWQQERVKLRLYVRDSGEGISAQSHQDLMRFFTQAESAFVDSSMVGLGLTISNYLVRLMGGHIHVESVAGLGSLFDFSLMIEWSENINHVQDQPFKHVSLLVAEDHDITQQTIKALLVAKGADVDLVNNGFEVIHQLCSNKRYDAVLMDVQMPEMDGIEATQIARRKGIDIPIIAITALVVKDDINQCMDAGMNDFIAKPIDKDFLMHTLSKWVSAQHNVDAETLVIFNVEKALKKVRSNKGLLVILLRNFINESHVIHENMESAFKVENYKTIESLSGILKGVANHIAAEQIFAILQTLEKAAFKKDKVSINKHLHSLFAALSRFANTVEAKGLFLK